ncbi:MAG: response regulator transcription factor [Chloroflexota bacterium]|nr:response regulator transcription factor [Chloroflexota bacterium]
MLSGTHCRARPGAPPDSQRGTIADGLPPPAPSQPQAQIEALGLTERECDVLRLIVQGPSNREIAADLYISETTIKPHINHIFAKLGARDRAQAIILAQRPGFVS